MARIALVEDKQILRDSLEAALSREDFMVSAFGDPLAASAQIRREPFDLIVTDLKMPGADGLTLIRELRESGCDAPVIVMTAFATVSTAVEAMKLGAFDYIQKPFEIDSLLVLIERAIEHARLRRENEALRASVNDFKGGRRLVGSGPAMRALHEHLERVCVSHATVLICGESGTGKELIASHVHQRSPRADGPLLCVNCAALSANLLESELFGHERGAFTGADRTRKGRFELADGGSLLLDEISELAAPLQAKLLRVLQEGEFERVGSSVTRRADVRVIATTNRNLEEWVSRKRFRQDLYYRLNVLPLEAPPLRERREDIPELVSHFLSRAAAQNGAASLSISEGATRLLMDYRWPGNVRELENLCCRAATLCSGPVIGVDLLEPWLRPKAAGADWLGPLREGRMLEDMERQLIERTLQRFGGHRARTAKALGMGLRTLGLKLKQWRDSTTAENDGLLVAAGVEIP